MLKVEGLFTESPNERGQIVKAAQDVTFEVPEGKLFVGADGLLMPVRKGQARPDLRHFE